MQFLKPNNETFKKIKNVIFLNADIIILSLLIQSLVLIIIFVSSAYLPPNGGYEGRWRTEPIADIASYIRNISITWDSKHYLEIAENWYSPTRSSHYAFFPLLPILIRGLTFILPFFSTNTISIILSWILYLTLAFFLKKAFKVLRPGANNFNLIITTLICPFSVFYVFVYTESLFVIISLISLFSYQRFKHISNRSRYLHLMLLLISSFALSTTRNLGVFLGISILLAEIVFTVIKKKNADHNHLYNNDLLSGFAVAASSILGLFAVFSIGYLTTKNLFVSFEVQKYWRRETNLNIFNTIYESIKQFTNPQEIYSTCDNYRDCVFGATYPLFALLIILTVFFLFSIVIYKKYNIDNKIEINPTILVSIIFSLFLLIVPITKGLGSYNRYIISTPIYYLGLPILINRFIPKKFSPLILIISSYFFAIFIILFSLHYWIG
ncbi:hypothetical protein HC864_01770 [Candidatus Gracilibacteria bacterium]|nr:hypothetical protein [Candidatus Gracilibacteria bacterium]